MPPDRVNLPPAKYDAVHRAVLSGLLGNVGNKTDTYEYTGARGVKFSIFPGSALFHAKPQWVVAAELVETTKLYARTVGRVRPEWVERLAEHLVKRAYSDPHWNAQTAHVTAYEKVTLYGLVLVPRRTVHYGPIDPKQSREIFIQHALVNGDYNSDAPFFRHNRRLIDEIRTLEAKSRAADVLADEKVQFDFYDSRVPANTHNGPAFEKWRREVERLNPKLLYMSRRDLMRHAAHGVTADLFPDTLVVSGVTLPLEYHFEPGHPADGVTATIPLAALNQMPAEQFEWLVPGLLKEKITALIKTLPKQLRVNFVPAPDVAEAAFATLKSGDGSLYDALATFLTRLKNHPVHRQDFDPGGLMDHLLMNFKVVDDSGRQVAGGRDLNAIKKQLGVAARETFAAMPAGEYHKDGIKSWDFGDLPESVEVKRHGMTLRGYPALVDNGPGEAVSLRLLDSLDAANGSHRAGVRRLFMLQVREDLAYLRRNIPDIDQLCLWYATLGGCDELKADLLVAAADRAFYDDDAFAAAPPRTHADYVAAAQTAWRRLLPVGRELSGLAKEALANYHELAKALAGDFAPALEPAVADMREQLAMLVPKNFLTATPHAWLRHLPRFLKGMQMRLRKLTNAGLSRDTAAAAVVKPFAENYRQRLAKHRKEGIVDPQLEQFRWMLEEFRVSLFAQELKTSTPISPQRLEKQWTLVKA